MGRVNDDNWLDEALNQAIHSDNTRPDFEQWKADHPEAVEMLTTRTPQARHPLRIRRIIMNATFIKLAAAAIAVAAIVGITQVMQPEEKPPEIMMSSGRALDLPGTVVEGPKTHTFTDGSVVKLAEGASIYTYSDAGKRGFEHVAGEIEVTVAKGRGEFIVTSPCGQVKALGTEFTMDLVDGVAENTGQAVKLLNVEVTEGSVEVRNAKGVQMLMPTQNAVVTMDSAPYDFNQDETLPEGLRRRIAAMVKAFETGDGAAWAANFNMDYIYRLGKGEVPYDPNLFGGYEADLERLRQGFGDIAGPQELVDRFLSSGGLNGSGKVYVQAVELSADGRHAQAHCVRRKSEHSVVITTPQWHHFDGGWWQVDD
jgi:ferric-dicitrate binding protein FerR (iron transport regulator)